MFTIPPTAWSVYAEVTALPNLPSPAQPFPALPNLSQPCPTFPSPAQLSPALPRTLPQPQLNIGPLPCPASVLQGHHTGVLRPGCRLLRFHLPVFGNGERHCSAVEAHLGTWSAADGGGQPEPEGGWPGWNWGQILARLSSRVGGLACRYAEAGDTCCDAADRGRLGASTFKRLNLGIAGLGAVYSVVFAACLATKVTEVDSLSVINLALALGVLSYCLYQWLYATNAREAGLVGLLFSDCVLFFGRDAARVDATEAEEADVMCHHAALLT
ncbi:uncharacterized protein HaLaN_05130 [Haematococcus lacustris]|uniref:Uncharacterized protein n=1 Tax=Haematococcus lacustris TaxID=44745 RepID=A0A699YSX6_HAELA|nr:uncharacterized protein HaLaN_05130 [Haematococcus lacustris]